MAYQSLYRRYRSQRFDEVLGQEHVTRALKNAVREDRVAQGYLFSGPRGTGKTSTARILAKVLNCEHPVDGEPDTTCANCRAVENGQMVDWLQELDAASNNGVGDMRSLLERVSMGTSGNRKVYILDEVHMLSTAASNALLKTLEEPPAHVVFVLATTEPEKVLPTIRSRTQHYEFNLLPASVLADHVRHVIDDAGLQLGEDAVEHVVRVGGGSARDTLSALDQVSAAGGVDDEGTPGDDLVDAIGARDAAGALVAVDAAVRAGRDPRVLAEALIESLRNAFLVAMGAPASGLSDRAVARAREVSQSLGPASLTRGLEAVGTALVEMRHAPDPRIPLEVALVRLTRPEAADDLSALVTRIEQLERAVASGTAITGTAPETATSPPDPPSSPAPGAPEPPAASAAAPAASPAASPRGADAARARLARQDATATEAPAPSTAPSAPAGSRPALGGVRRSRTDADTTPPAVHAPELSATEGRADAVVGQADPVPPSPPAPSPSPAASRPEPASAGSGVPATAELARAWEDTVLASLRPRAKALFKPGHFVEGGGRTARFALPNEPHRNNCERCRDEVAAALAAHFGRPVPLELVVDPGSAATPATGGRSSSDDTERASDPAADDDLDDLDDLVDAPDASTGGIAQLQDAFPGAELLEEP